MGDPIRVSQSAPRSSQKLWFAQITWSRASHRTMPAARTPSGLESPTTSATPGSAHRIVGRGCARNASSRLKIEIEDDDHLVLLNAHHEAIDFVLPEGRDPAGWEVALDTGRDRMGTQRSRGRYALQGRSLVVLRQRRAPA